MKAYLNDILPKIQRYSEMLDNVTLLSSKHWIVIDEGSKIKTTYIFRQNGDLLISQNGEVEKAHWEYLGNRTLLVDRAAKSYLFKHGFFNESILALKVDSSDEFALLVNSSVYESGINSTTSVSTYLTNNYISNSHKELIGQNLEIDPTNNSGKTYVVEDDGIHGVGVLATICIILIAILVTFLYTGNQ